MVALALPADTVRFYNDGPAFPTTPLLQEAEREYRDAFSIGASATASWKEVPDDLLEAVWRTRREVRRRNEVFVPSSVMFGNPDMDSEQIVYRIGHEVEASRARGKVQALEIARQCWESL